MDNAKSSQNYLGCFVSFLVLISTLHYSETSNSGTAGPGPEPTCAGKTVTLSGQTCQEVSTSNGISTRSLLMANGLSGDCYGFPQSGTLCIPNKSVCKTYTVKQGDTCRTIGSANGVTKPQLISWNPELGSEFPEYDVFQCTNKRS